MATFYLEPFDPEMTLQQPCKFFFATTVYIQHSVLNIRMLTGTTLNCVQVCPAEYNGSTFTITSPRLHLAAMSIPTQSFGFCALIGHLHSDRG